MRVIVCGGRNYNDADTMWRVLSVLVEACTLVHGGARGADRLAANMWPGEVEEHPAEWERLGNRAGIVRNQTMLDSGADLVIAFPGGRGTADMVRRARKAGVPVLAVQP